MLDLSEVNFAGVKGYKFINQDLETVILPKLGGRIASFSNGEIELFFSWPNLADFEYDLAVDDIISYRKDLDYPPLGGYKTWLAPQSKWGWPPYLDLELGEYEFKVKKELDQIKTILTSPICRESGMQFKREVILKEDSDKLKIKQQMINRSTKIKEYGLWDVTQIQGDGQVVVEVAGRNSLINLMEEDVLKSVEIIIIADKEYAIIKCNSEKEFKLGVKNSSSWILALVEKDGMRSGYLKEVPEFKEAEFGHGAAFEIFATYKYDYFEVEAHGPMKQLKPEESFSFAEKWSILNWDKEITIEEIIKDVNVKVGGV